MLIESGLPNLMHRGKVRDTYAIDDILLLMVATDRISPSTWYYLPESPKRAKC
jgi:phosphoribosylaminoimidazole-succinocarboxamide synthase